MLPEKTNNSLSHVLEAVSMKWGNWVFNWCLKLSPEIKTFEKLWSIHIACRIINYPKLREKQIMNNLRTLWLVPWKNHIYWTLVYFDKYRKNSKIAKTYLTKLPLWNTNVLTNGLVPWHIGTIGTSKTYKRKFEKINSCYCVATLENVRV